MESAAVVRDAVLEYLRGRGFSEGRRYTPDIGFETSEVHKGGRKGHLDVYVSSGNSIKARLYMRSYRSMVQLELRCEICGVLSKGGTRCLVCR